MDTAHSMPPRLLRERTLLRSARHIRATFALTSARKEHRRSQRFNLLSCYPPTSRDPFGGQFWIATREDHRSIDAFVLVQEYL